MISSLSHHKYTSGNPSYDKQGDSNTASSQILLATMRDDTTWNKKEMEALLLDTSLHTILPRVLDDDHHDNASIEQQLSALEKESNNFFETLEKKEHPLPGVLLHEHQHGSDQHDDSSTVSQTEQDITLHYEECCDISLGTKESAISSGNLLSEIEEGSTTQEEGFLTKLDPTNHSSEVFHFVDGIKVDYERNEKASPLSLVLVQSFVKEYETRAKDLRTCMNRTKSTRSKVAKVKQYLKKRSNKFGANEAVLGVTKMAEEQLS